MHKGGWGGQPNRILLLSKGLIERGHFVIIAAPKGATLIKRAQQYGIPTFDDLEFPKKFKPHVTLKEILKLKRVIEENDIDIVHTHGSQDTWAATIAAKLCTPPKIVVRTRHNTFPVANHPGNRLLHRVMIDYVIVVSQGIVNTYKKTGVLGDKINFIKNIYSAVDPAKFDACDEMAKNVKQEFQLGNELVFVKVGRLAKEKGHKNYIKIAKNLSKLLKSKFFALGEGPLREDLERLCRQEGLESCFYFTGLRNDVCGFLRNSDTFIFTPISGESLGTAVLESLYNKLPPVSFNIRGIDASVEHGQNGFLTEVKDTETATKYTLKIATSKKLRTRLGCNGKRKIEKQFLINKLVKDTEKLYYELINNH
ncbi:glycosyltransferase family 4 protein [Thermosulfidibacter takaii]|nr:glycosyltransferase family 4 protein [Thermosulfidibacter takaii]